MAITGFAEIRTPLSPAAQGERVVAVGHAGHVHVIDIATGRALWTRALAGTAGASACDGQPVTVGIEGEIVLAGSMGHIFALRLGDGSVLWHVDHRGRGTGDTSLAVGGPVEDYVASLGPPGGLSQ